MEFPWISREGDLKNLKKLLFFSLLFFISFTAVACDNTTTTTTSTSDTTTTTSETTSTTDDVTFVTTTSADVSNVEVLGYSSNGTKLFEPNLSISGWDSSSSTITNITVAENLTYQTFYGTGAALTQSSAYVISQSPDRDQIVNYLFSESGLHIQLVRLTVGASDFVTSEMGHYTYDDTVGNVADMELANFTLEKDAQIISILQDALEINPDIVFIAAPWSAPAWMKTNKSLYGGALKTIYYNSYANYLIRYLEEMDTLGIHIRYLSVQNEPYNGTWDYPGMTWTTDTTKIFIRDFLGPKIVESGLETGVMIWDHNTVDGSGTLIDFPVTVLQSSAASVYINSIGVHCYSGNENDMYDYLDYLHENNPEVEVFMTECTAITTYKDVESNMEWSLRRMYLEAYNRFASGTTYWNIVLDPQGTVHLGGCGNCTGLLSVPIDGSHGYTLEADGYVTGHFNKDIASGAKKIYVKSSSTAILSTGFVDSNGKVTLVLFNDGAEKTTTVHWRDHTFTVTLPRNSLTTLYWTYLQEGS